ncbi:MAG: type II secretion system major pseudopilin GspG [Methylotenera sp.]|nr:type II secretion system major pseudopilin GspG [Methylotenera sp.]
MQPRRCLNRPYSSGFTLLELLVVVVIIGLLVSIVAPRYFSQLGKSEVKAAKAQISAISKALDMYRLDTGHYPSQEVGLQALLVAPSGEAKWQGPYLEKAIPPDPWNTPYQYRMPGEAGDYDLISLGKDGKVGGKEDDADLSNH